MSTLAISEVFKSIQGESSWAGFPCSFVRTAGCNLRCTYCDTQYARDGKGIRIGVDEVRAEVESHATRLVCITGGEPLVQSDGVVALCRGLVEDGHTVLLETNGTLDLSPVPEEVLVIKETKQGNMPSTKYDDWALGRAMYKDL